MSGASGMNGNGNGRRRVVVTGMGALSALGNDVDALWSGLMEGRSGVRTIEAFDPSRVDSKIAAERKGASTLPVPPRMAMNTNSPEVVQ